MALESGKDGAEVEAFFFMGNMLAMRSLSKHRKHELSSPTLALPSAKPG
jgi:hypothetical protein